jgi:DNA-binding transcriptional ArsR family regulator
MTKELGLMTKITGKFYPLQHAEWLRVCKELSPTAKDVLYYIRTIDPYSDGVEISATQIARDLGVHRSTVSRALKDLERKGFIDLELIQVKVRVLAKGLLCTEQQPCCKGATPDAESQQPVSDCNQESEETTIGAISQQPTPEIKTQKEFYSPNTYKTLYTNQTNGGEDLTRRYGDKGTWREGSEDDYKIPEDLKNKLSELSIPLDNKVLKAIASHHLSPLVTS